MARIKKYSSEDTNDEIPDLQNKISIKKSEETVVLQNQPAERTITASENRTNVVEIIIELFGIQVFENLQNNKDINIGTDDNLNNESSKSWLEKRINTYFTDEDIILIENNLNNNFLNFKTENEILLQKISEKEKFADQLKSDIKTIETETDNLFNENKNLKIELASKIEFSKVIESIFRTDPEKTIKTLLIEAANDYGSEETDDFILSFISGWMRVSVTVPLAYGNPDEEDGIELLDDALRFLLEQVRNKSVPQRRALLDAVARFVSSKFKEFDFVSPEESSQIDINLHSVQGTGGSKIKQGISYAVVRKQNRRTFKFADVESI